MRCRGTAARGGVVEAGDRKRVGCRHTWSSFERFNAQVSTGLGVRHPSTSLAALDHCPEIQLSQSKSLSTAPIFSPSSWSSFPFVKKVIRRPLLGSFSTLSFEHTALVSSSTSDRKGRMFSGPRDWRLLVHLRVDGL